MNAPLPNMLLIAAVCAFATAGSAEEIAVPVEATPNYSERQLERAADAINAQLEARWYDFEFIVFERLRVLEFNTVERLVQPVARQWPKGLTDVRGEGASRYVSGGGAICLGHPEIPADIPRNDRTLAFIRRQARDGDSRRSLDASGESIADTPKEPPSAIERAISAFEAGLARDAFQWLPTSPDMARQVRLINRRAHLRPLLHQRLRAAVPERSDPMRVQVAFPAGSEEPRLSGYFGLSAGRYLHWETELWYQAPGLGSTPMVVPAVHGFGAKPDGIIRMSDRRRMRSGEMHYIDHPKIGVLVKATPVEVPQELKVAWLEAQAAD